MTKQEYFKRMREVVRDAVDNPPTDAELAEFEQENNLSSECSRHELIAIILTGKKLLVDK